MVLLKLIYLVLVINTILNNLYLIGGSNMILKVVSVSYFNRTLYCLCVNTIGFSFFIKATEVILNTN